MKAEDSRRVNAGEARSGRNPEDALRGAEADVTTRLRTKAEPEGLMEAVCERGNLMLAYQRVVQNKGAAGVDGGDYHYFGHDTAIGRRVFCQPGGGDYVWLGLCDLTDTGIYARVVLQRI